MVQQTIVIVIQSLIMVGIALLAGAHFEDGVLGVAGLIGRGADLGRVRRAVDRVRAGHAAGGDADRGVQFLLLPLTFISST